MTKKYVSSHVFFRKSQKTSGNSSSIFKLSVFAAAAILSQSAAAQNPTNEEEADNTIELKDTYVRPDYVEIERMRDTKEIIVIPKEDIQDHGNRTISDVLKSVPGISVNASGPGDIDIRGQGQDQAARNIQVLLDGAPITTLINHPYSTNYDVIPVEQLERIEIIPGGGQCDLWLRHRRRRRQHHLKSALDEGAEVDRCGRTQQRRIQIIRNSRSETQR